MVPSTHPQTGLAIIFEREGQEIDHRFAADGSAAARTLIIMIAELGVLQPGDRLMIEPNDDMVVDVLGPRGQPTVMRPEFRSAAGWHRSGGGIHKD